MISKQINKKKPLPQVFLWGLFYYIFPIIVSCCFFIPYTEIPSMVIIIPEHIRQSGQNEPI